ncbi:hypothetical protein [uncultured Flavobacterium sp.]|uniref:hypothetical protein n=1 Tax=uncultured Flavobacterium sp. TaxID=165435 RepID=UPI0025FD8912|nr:hypothetical protein [uncultured Flavobacterium sp.]
MINILYIGRHPEILETVVRLLNANEEWFGAGAETDEMAMELFEKINFQIVLLGCGIEMESEEKLCAFFQAQNPNCTVVQHYGGGSGLLKNEILSALENHNFI